MDAATGALPSGDRVVREAIKTALARANNNTNFVLPYSTSPVPVFS